MASYILAPLAREDTLAIVDYIALDDPIAATRWIDKLEEKLELLAEQPGSRAAWHRRATS